MQLRPLAARILALSLLGFHLYTALFGTLAPLQQRATHLGLVVALIYVIKPGRGRIGAILTGAAALVSFVLLVGYYNFKAEEFTTRILYVTPVAWWDVLLGGLLLLLILDAARRMMGWSLSIIATLFLVYQFFGHLLPNRFSFRPFSLENIIEHQVIPTQGVFGIPLGVSATYATIFILLGVALELSGGGEFFVRLSSALMGRAPGGPAKVAVLGSALMGSISGSSVANVFTTGPFTIPLMRRIGYRPEYAATVEAVASTGARFCPL